MQVSRFTVQIFLACVVLVATPGATGQVYPHKPIRIVTTAAGGGSDMAARLIAPAITGPLGQPVIVDNRPGSVIPIEVAAKAQPDGYTLLLYTSTVWLAPFLYDVSYDPVKDFVPITLATRSPNLVVVHPSLAVFSIKELIAAAKAKPGELNYASTGPGSSSHLSAELFKAMTGVNIVGISYKGTAPALSDTIGGQVQMQFPTAASVSQHVKAGKLRALAVTSAQPSALTPGIPTVAASGVPGYESIQVYCVFAPAGVSEVIVRRLNQEIVRVLDRQDMKDKFFGIGVEVVASTPEQFASAIKSEMTRMGRVIKEAGIRAN